MPGTSTWTGASADGNWSTAGNWSTSGGSSAPPASTDNVIISGGDRDITAGLNQSAITLASLKVTDGFRYNIGDTSNSLQINCSGDTNIVLAGQFIKINGTFSTASTAFTVSFKSQGEFACTGAFVNLIVGGFGTVTITSGATVTDLHVNGPNVNAAYNATGFTFVCVGAGNLTTGRSIATIVGSSGRLITQLAAAITTRAVVTPNFKFNHQASGTITELETINGSEFTPEGNVSGSVTVTRLLRHKGANVIRDVGGINATFTSERVVGW